MDVDFSGKWVLSSSDNFEAYLDAMGAQKERKEQILRGNALHIIEQSGNSINVTYKTTNATVQFTVGQEDEQSIPNTKIKGAIRRQGTKLIFCGQTAESHKYKKTWEIIHGELVKIFEYQGVKAVRKFKII